MTAVLEISSGSLMPVAPISMIFLATMSTIGSLRSTRCSWRSAQMYARFSLPTSSGPSPLPFSKRFIGIAQCPLPAEYYAAFTSIKQTKTILRTHCCTAAGKPTALPAISGWPADASRRITTRPAPHRGSLNSSHIHGTRVPGGGAVHSIRTGSDRRYSITSSARASSVAGTVIPMQGGLSGSFRQPC